MTKCRAIWEHKLSTNSFGLERFEVKLELHVRYSKTKLRVKWTNDFSDMKFRINLQLYHKNHVSLTLSHMFYKMSQVCRYFLNFQMANIKFA